MVREHVETIRMQRLWDEAVEREKEAKATLKAISMNYEDIVGLVEEWDSE